MFLLKSNYIRLLNSYSVKINLFMLTSQCKIRVFSNHLNEIDKKSIAQYIYTYILISVFTSILIF